MIWFMSKLPSVKKVIVWKTEWNCNVSDAKHIFGNEKICKDLNRCISDLEKETFRSLRLTCLHSLYLDQIGKSLYVTSLAGKGRG